MQKVGWGESPTSSYVPSGLFLGETVMYKWMQSIFFPRKKQYNMPLHKYMFGIIRHFSSPAPSVKRERKPPFILYIRRKVWQEVGDLWYNYMFCCCVYKTIFGYVAFEQNFLWIINFELNILTITLDDRVHKHLKNKSKKPYDACGRRR